MNVPHFFFVCFVYPTEKKKLKKWLRDAVDGAHVREEQSQKSKRRRRRQSGQVLQLKLVYLLELSFQVESVAEEAVWWVVVEVVGCSVGGGGWGGGHGTRESAGLRVLRRAVGPSLISSRTFFSWVCIVWADVRSAGFSDTREASYVHGRTRHASRPTWEDSGF